MSQLMVSFKGTTPPPWILAGLRQGEIAALCLFAFNIDSLRQLRDLTGQLYRAAHKGNQPAPLVGIDQEGGQLMAVTGGATELPGNMALGATGSSRLAEEAGRILGLELLALGCNLNFAPVLDLSQHPDNPAVGVRAFGDDPALVAHLGSAMIRGMQSVGVLATAKHFPGHGDTSTDSHRQAPQVLRTRGELEACELIPFRAALASGVAAVMSAHIRYPALDKLPATLSAAILQGLLREQLGFDGLIITDAMDMQALADYSALERNEAALQAGADLVLLGHLPDQAGLIRALRGSLRPQSIARIRSVRERLLAELPPAEVIGCREHQQTAQAIADASITLVRDKGQLPLELEPHTRVAVITTKADDLTPADTSSAVTVRLAEAVRARHASTQAISLPYLASAEALSGVLQAALAADIIIVGTINAESDPSQTELVRELQRRGKRPIVVALRSPFDLRAFPAVETYLCTYSIRQVSTEAAARVLFGEIPARGHLPCRLDVESQGIVL